MKVKKYRKDHEKIKVKCPLCNKIMAGWHYTIEFPDRYEIIHKNPTKRKRKRKGCVLDSQQMIPIRQQWEAKYETVEEDG